MRRFFSIATKFVCSSPLPCWPASITGLNAGVFASSYAVSVGPKKAYSGNDKNPSNFLAMMLLRLRPL